MRRILLAILIISSLALTAPASTPASAAEKTAILLGQDYFQTTHQAIEKAKESIYVAMYLINVGPDPTPNNPASILLEDLITPTNEASPSKSSSTTPNSASTTTPTNASTKPA